METKLSPSNLRSDRQSLGPRTELQSLGSRIELQLWIISIFTVADIKHVPYPLVNGGATFGQGLVCYISREVVMKCVLNGMDSPGAEGHLLVCPVKVVSIKFLLCKEQLCQLPAKWPWIVDVHLSSYGHGKILIHPKLHSVSRHIGGADNGDRALPFAVETLFSSTLDHRE